MGDFSKAAMIEFNVGKFLFSREACIIAYAWDRLLHRQKLVIECKSIVPTDNEVKFNDIKIPKENSTRVDIRMLIFEMYPREDQVVDMRCLVNTDPKLWFAPSLLINYIFKKVIDTLILGRNHVHRKDPQILRVDRTKGMGKKNDRKEATLRLAQRNGEQIFEHCQLRGKRSSAICSRP